MSLINKFAYCLLIGAILYLTFQNWQKDQYALKLEMEALKNNTLIGSLQSQVTIEKNRVKVVYRDKEKVIVRYIPIEGTTTITTTISGETSINRQWYGFCLNPFIGISTPLQPTLGARIAFMDRYGLSLIANDKTLGIGVDTRIGFGFDNTHIGIFYPTGVYLSVDL